MTINDLIEYDPVSNPMLLMKLMAVLFGISALGFTVAIRAGYRKGGVRPMIIPMAATFVLLAVAGIATEVVLGPGKEKEEAAIAGNAKTFQSWVESSYGFDVSDDAAGRVMENWGSAWTTGRDLTFETSGEDSIVLELHENADGSFSLVHDKTELEPQKAEAL